MAKWGELHAVTGLQSFEGEGKAEKGIPEGKSGMFVKQAEELIAAERKRQIEGENWSAEGDDCYICGDLERAGLCYLFQGTEFALPGTGEVPRNWPWDVSWWKPRGRQADLVRAGALFMAEADRVSRADNEPGAALALHQIAVARLAELIAFDAATTEAV